jgi:hypothetical protein
MQRSRACVLVFVVMCPRLRVARSGAGCQGGVRVVFLGARPVLLQSK